MATIPGVMFIPHGHSVSQIPDGDWIAFGTNSSDTILGGHGNDIIFGGGGNDMIVGGHGDDVIFGGGGNDLLIGGDGGDSIFGGNGNDTIVGGHGDQSLFGGGGNDIITAGQGNQLLVGGTGGDVLTAGQGNDTLIGGGGHDTFVFGSGGGRNVVMDFQHGDVLQIQQNINGLHVTSAADLASHIGNDGHGNAVIDLGQGDSVTLIGVKPEELQHDLSSIVKVH